MNREELIKEIDNATNAMREITRVVNEALCHARHYKSNEETEEAYNKGLEDAWEMAKKLYNMTCSESEKIFDVQGGFYEVIRDFTPQEALAKLEAYEKSKEINVGDVVEAVENKRVKVIVTSLQEKNMFNGIDAYGRSFSSRKLDGYKKTNKHIDITSVLEQLRGDKDE